jgi:hypothetical protein
MPVQGGDADARPPRDLPDVGRETAFGEGLARGLQHLRPVRAASQH